MGEGQEDVFLCADSIGHVLLLVVKLVVAGLGAANHLGQRIVLTVERQHQCFVRLLGRSRPLENSKKQLKDIFDFFVSSFTRAAL